MPSPATRATLGTSADSAIEAALGERVEHRLEGGDAGLVHEAAAVIARAADRADAEPLARRSR